MPHYYGKLFEQRTTFMRRYCNVCSGKIYRCYLEGRTPADDNGNELVLSQVHDRCSDCPAILQQTATVAHPLTAIEGLFALWETGGLAESEFDQELARLLHKSDAWAS